MATPDTPLSDPLQRRAEARLRRHLHDHWKAYAFQGGLAIIVGFLALLAPFAATLATTIFLGWLLVLGGILAIISAFRARGAPGFWANLFLAVLSVILGGILIANPIAGSITLTWMLATYFVLSGVMNFVIASAFRASTGRFWLVVLSGIIDIALALFLILGLPLTAIWAVGIFIGISFLSSGFALLFAALDARNSPPTVA